MDHANDIRWITIQKNLRISLEQIKSNYLETDTLKSFLAVKMKFHHHVDYQIAI